MPEKNPRLVDQPGMLWFLFLALNIFIIIELLNWCKFADSPHTMLAAAVGVMLPSVLLTAPLIRFLTHAWDARWQEFRNRLNYDAMRAYLLQFWQARLQDYYENRTAGPQHDKEANADAEADVDAESSKKMAIERRRIRARADSSLFKCIYEEHYGRNAFLIPMFTLVVVANIQALLVAFYLIDSANLSSQAVRLSLPMNEVAVAAIIGAYLFIVTDIVMNVRQRSLNSSDIQLHALRLFAAVPIASAFVNIASSGKGPDFTPGVNGYTAFAFCLGAFPMDMVVKFMRRFTNKQLTAIEASQDNDQLIRLEGVTVGVSALLLAEGVSSIEQLIGMDPVLLAIRTGLPFKLILRLSSQAVVRRHFGDAATQLLPLGLADAEPVYRLVELLDSSDQKSSELAQKTIGAAVGLLLSDSRKTIDADSLQFNFRQIAQESYTRFLIKSPLENDIGGNDHPAPKPS